MASSGSQWEWHPFANLFPLMSHEDLHELSKSIQTNGLRVPILLDQDGRVLDGRNRLMACAAADVVPTFEVWEGDDSSALQHVVDINLQRRHLDEGQRALVAARLANVAHGGARRGQAAHAPLETVTQRQAAARLAVSERTVRDGKLVLDHAPDEMRAAVEDGLLAVRTAAELIRAAGRDRALATEYYRLRRSSQSQEWYTPKHLLALVEDVFGAPIDLDPASNSHTDPWVPARKHYTADDDGLSLPWHGRVFLNPPFSAGPRAWVEKLRDSHVAGHVPEAIALLPARTNTVWIRTLASYPRCFITGRLKYSDGPGFAPFASVAVYLGPNGDRFGAVFTPIGDVYVPWQPQDRR